MFEEELTPILHNPFNKTEEEETLPNSFYEARIVIMSEISGKQREGCGGRTKDKYPSWIHDEIFNRILANQTQMYVTSPAKARVSIQLPGAQVIPDLQLAAPSMSVLAEKSYGGH